LTHITNRYLSLLTSDLLSYHIHAQYLYQYLSVVSSSGPHSLCLKQFQCCCPSVWNSLPSGICACSSSITHSVVFYKPTVSRRPSVPPSGSHKCLRFGLWPSLHAI